jgi:hypothetical protein
MRDRVPTIGPIAAMAGAIGLCCGLPVLLSLGIAGAIAGWSLQSWVLIGLGLVLAGAGWARWVRGRRRDRRLHRPIPTAHADTSPVQNADSSTDVTSKENNP